MKTNIALLLIALVILLCLTSCTRLTSGGVNWEQYNKSKRLNAENAFNAASFRTGGRSYLDY